MASKSKSLGTKVALTDSSHSIPDKGTIEAGTVTGNLSVTGDQLDGALDVSSSLFNERNLHNIDSHAFGPGAARAKGLDPGAVPPGFPTASFAGVESKQVTD